MLQELAQRSGTVKFRRPVPARLPFLVAYPYLPELA